MGNSFRSRVHPHPKSFISVQLNQHNRDLLMDLAPVYDPLSPNDIFVMLSNMSKAIDSSLLMERFVIKSLEMVRERADPEEHDRLLSVLRKHLGRLVDGAPSWLRRLPPRILIKLFPDLLRHKEWRMLEMVDVLPRLMSACSEDEKLWPAFACVFDHPVWRPSHTLAWVKSQSVPRRHFEKLCVYARIASEKRAQLKRVNIRSRGRY